jgi:6,7-dimethyl-8-ribityllumazine synthase
MIKGITTIHVIKKAAEWQKLAALLDSLGFERGTGWKDAKSRGASFLAPIGNLEIVYGQPPTPADAWIEVTDLDQLHTHIKKSKTGEPGPIEPTHWKSRMFILKVADLKLAFWQFDSPRPFAGQTTEGELNVTGAKFGIVVSRFNALITERLVQGALDALRRSGTREKDIEIVRVPGAWEVPMAARQFAKAKKPDAIICLGLLMRGETSNYEHISNEVARGIGQASQDTGIAMTYGVLTCDTLEQAIDRAGLKMGNKGFEAAITAIEMVSLSRKFKSKKKVKR